MARREGPVHVAIITRTVKGRVYQTTLLRRTYRDGPKVKHETLGNLSHLPPHLIEAIRRGLRGEAVRVGEDVWDVCRSRPHGHVAAVLSVMDALGLRTLLSSTASRERDVCLALIASRLLFPGSKLETARRLSPETLTSTLGECLGLGSVSERELYAAMDWLRSRQRRIEHKLAKRHLEAGTLVLYDVSSSYYTGSTCPLAKHGYSRDRKRGFPQIIYGLLCNREGCPIAIEVFPGNTSDPKTLAPMVETLRRRFGLTQLVWVGDRGLLTEARLSAELKPRAGFDWITALRHPQIHTLVEGGAIQLSLFDERDLVEVTSPEYPGERLIVCRNPLRAEEAHRKREALLTATEKLVAPIVAAVSRSRRPLRDRATIGRRLGRVLNRYKVEKLFTVEVGDDTLTVTRNTAAIAQEAALDGLYAIRTSVGKESFSAHEVVSSYKRLGHVEQAFRCFKQTDLEIRPIYHRLSERVRAHVFLALLAYYVEWHLRKAWAPILFEDAEADSQAQKRRSIVAPAQRSDSALKKAETKRTPDNLPVHSLASLLADLGTIVKNRCVPKRADGAPTDLASAFDLTTSPTPSQQAAFDLLHSALGATIAL